MKVSIIIPVYNNEKYLEVCIESACNQSYSNLEIILVNDGSTDNSLNICKNYAEKDIRIKIIEKNNSGVSSARNVGLKKSTGEYILFLDSDDYIDTNMIKDMVYKIKKYDTDLVICGFIVFDQDKSIKQSFGNELIQGKENIASFYSKLNGRTNSPTNKLYKNNLITKKFDESLHLGEDLIFNLDYVESCYSLVCIDKCYYHYRRDNKNSITNNFNEQSFDIAEMLHLRLKSYVEINNNKPNLIDINRYFVTDTISYMNKYINSTQKGLIDKKAMITNILENENLRKALSDIKGISKKYYLIGLLMEKKLVSFVYFTIRIKYMFERIKFIKK